MWQCTDNVTNQAEELPESIGSFFGIEENMARYIEDVGIDQPFDVVSMTMEDYIYHNHFIRTDWQGEPVYGSRTADGKERFLKWSYSCGILHIEAWLKNAFGNETDLDGAGKSKAEYKRSLEKLVQDLRNHSGEMFESGYIGHDPLQHGESEQKADSGWTQTEQKADSGWTQAERETDAAQPAWSEQHPTYQRPISIGTGSGTVGKFLNPTGPGLGVAALLLSLFIPTIGIVIGIMGIQRYKMTGDPDKDKALKTGKMLCIAALVISILSIIFPLLVGGLMIPLQYFLEN